MFQIEVSTLVIILLLFTVSVIAYVNIIRQKANTKLSKLNEKIIESEEKYKLVVENSPDIMFIQKEGKILFANRQFIKMSGYPMKDLLNKSIFDFVSKEERELVVERARLRLLDYDIPTSYEIKTVNRYKKIRYFDLKINPTTHNGKSALLGVGTDISSRKKNLETIRKLSIAIEQSPASVVIFDNNGVIEYANEAFSMSTGYKSKVAVGLNIKKLNPNNYNIAKSEEFWKTISSGMIWTGELQSKRSNGELFWEKVSVSPIFDTNGLITHYSAVTQDISLQKEMLARLLESEKQLKEVNATKDRFFSIIAHDLKNPFNAIMGYASLLLSQFDDLNKSEKLDYIENINIAADSTYSLLENILEWSRTQTGKIDFNPESFDISTVINEIFLLVRPQAEAKNIRLISKVKYQTFVYADVNMIKTVLRNLVSNAIKFTEKGEVLIETEETKSSLMISVIDTGIGIADDVMDKLFKIDQQVHTSGTKNEKGTGLGLILSKEFVNINGGEIWINRMKGQGTIFNFTLPIN